MWKHTDYCLRQYMHASKMHNLLFLLLALLSIPLTTYAAVFDIQPADVTTRAASVVWVSDEPVLDASVRVFTDIDGVIDITDGLTLNVVSASFPPAHDNGIVKVEIVGLSPNTPVYIQTETTTASGLIQEPAMGPFIEITTAAETTKVNSSDQPIVNDLIKYQLFAPDGATAATGTLMLLKANGTSRYPVSAFVSEGGVAAPDVIVDMNNLFDSAGKSLEILPDQVIEITHYRGLLCSSDISRQALGVRYRAPAHAEAQPIVELEDPVQCFFSNLDCNDIIDIVDVQALLNIWGTTVGGCRFNPSFDINGDGQINIIDFQSILNQWNKTRPFI
jgi:hypothetical protein